MVDSGQVVEVEFRSVVLLWRGWVGKGRNRIGLRLVCRPWYGRAVETLSVDIRSSLSPSHLKPS